MVWRRRPSIEMPQPGQTRPVGRRPLAVRWTSHQTRGWPRPGRSSSSTPHARQWRRGMTSARSRAVPSAPRPRGHPPRPSSQRATGFPHQYGVIRRNSAARVSGHVVPRGDRCPLLWVPRVSARPRSLPRGWCGPVSPRASMSQAWVPGSTPWTMAFYRLRARTIGRVAGGHPEGPRSGTAGRLRARSGGSVMTSVVARMTRRRPSGHRHPQVGHPQLGRPTDHRS
jgi:hypothetical protein